jgi:hypothetical protein
MTLKERSKKIDLKRGRLVDKYKEPLLRQRNHSATKQVGCRAGLPDFYWYNIPKRVGIYHNGGKYTKWP